MEDVAFQKDYFQDAVRVGHVVAHCHLLSLVQVLVQRQVLKVEAQLPVHRQPPSAHLLVVLILVKSQQEVLLLLQESKHLRQV